MMISKLQIGLPEYIHPQQNMLQLSSPLSENSWLSRFLPTGATNTRNEAVYTPVRSNVERQLNAMPSHHVRESKETYNPGQLLDASTITVMSCQPVNHRLNRCL